MKNQCPTCGSTDRDVFQPVVLFFYVRMCPDAWHEDRIVKRVKKRMPKTNQRASRAKAASRQEKTNA